MRCFMRDKTVSLPTPEGPLRTISNGCGFGNSSQVSVIRP